MLCVRALGVHYFQMPILPKPVFHMELSLTYCQNETSGKLGVPKQGGIRGAGHAHSGGLRTPRRHGRASNKKAHGRGGASLLDAGVDSSLVVVFVASLA
jgi:hypothetical protein